MFFILIWFRLKIYGYKYNNCSLCYKTLSCCANLHLVLLHNMPISHNTLPPFTFQGFHTSMRHKSLLMSCSCPTCCSDATKSLRGPRHQNSIIKEIKILVFLGLVDIWLTKKRRGKKSFEKTKIFRVFGTRTLKMHEPYPNQ